MNDSRALTPAQRLRLIRLGLIQLPKPEVAEPPRGKLAPPLFGPTTEFQSPSSKETGGPKRYLPLTQKELHRRNLCLRCGKPAKYYGSMLGHAAHCESCMVILRQERRDNAARQIVISPRPL